MGLSNIFALFILLASHWIHLPCGVVRVKGFLLLSTVSPHSSYTQLNLVELVHLNFQEERFRSNAFSDGGVPSSTKKTRSFIDTTKEVSPSTSILVNEASQLLSQENKLYAPPSLKEYLFENSTLCSVHKEQIQQLWYLIRSKGSIRHYHETECQLVVEALTIAYIALRGKNTSRSLEESIERAAGIAAVLGELKADASVVLAGILHDVVCDVDADQKRYLTNMFGKDVVLLSEQYCRLPRFMARRTQYTDMQAENQLQMLVALAEDYRTLYIRLADRLHTMRVLRNLPLGDRDRTQIALEARNVYAELAHKMGVMKVRSELEDLAFKILEPDMFQVTRYTQVAAEKAYRDATARIEEFIQTDRILVEKKAQLRLTHRIKSKYQLYLKMQRKGLKSPNEVRDALGLRLIVDIPKLFDETDAQHAERKVAMCYYIVNRLRHMPGWEPAREGFKDYIQAAKPNGYQSLHQYIRNLALGTNVEVQVRTKEMHVTAELGQAAHWCYKDHIYRPEIASSKTYRTAWRSESQMRARSSAELIGLAKKQLTSARVFVYLEDLSTVLNLKKGATALDGAFAIHTMMGLTASEVMVNNQSVELSHLLNNGDVISVNCHAVGTHGAPSVPVVSADVDMASMPLQQAVHPSKMGLVRTKYALAALRKYFREHNKESLICMGIVKLLMSFDLNAQTHKLALVDAKHLATQVKERTNLPIHEFLCNLGYATAAEDSERMLAQVFRVPFAQLQSAPYATALMWACMQGHRYGSGWENQHVLQRVLLPLLREILPPLLARTEPPVDAVGTAEGPIAPSSVEAAWCEMVGEKSLCVETEISAPVKEVEKPTGQSSLLVDHDLHQPDDAGVAHSKVVQRPLGHQAPALLRLQVAPAKEAVAERLTAAAATAQAGQRSPGQGTRT